MRRALSIIVRGIPQQQGSKTAFVIGKRAVMKDANEKALKPWRDDVKKAAEEEWGDKPLLLGPVRIAVAFVFPRPKNHYGSGRNADVLKSSAPYFKTSTPDLDKLQRAIGDSLSGTIFKDDAQVVEWNASKSYAYDYPYALVHVFDLAGGSHDAAGEVVSGEGSYPGEDRP